MTSLVDERGEEERCPASPDIVGGDGTVLRDERPFGRYKLLRLLGEGGMASVHEAYDPKHDRRLALKVLKPEWQREADALARFLREARAAGGLSHPHIVTIYDSGEEPAPYIAMELIDGTTLVEVLRRPQRLGVAEAVRLARELAAALAYAHARGRVHRDIKPSNVLLAGPRLELKLADFGIAAIATEMTQLTRVDHTPGTPRYMSPEQWRGEPADARGDLFSLGVTFYEMLSGRHAFTAATADLLGYQIIHEPPPSLSGEAPQVSPELAAIVHRLLAKRAEDRFQSADELLAALDALGREPRRVARKAVAMAAAGTALMALGGGGLWWWRAAPDDRPPVATAAERTIAYGQELELDLGALASDPDGDRLEFTAALEPGAPGDLRREGARIRYDPGPALARLPRGESRTVHILYRADDGRGPQAAARVAVKVTGSFVPDHPPETVDDRARTIPGQPVVLDVLGNDRDPDAGDELRLVAAEMAPGSPGSVRIVDGRLAYDPGPLPPQQPVAEIRYTVADGSGAETRGRASVSIEVPPPALSSPPVPPRQKASPQDAQPGGSPPRRTPSSQAPSSQAASPEPSSDNASRCRRIVQSFQLGGSLSGEDQAFLQSRCRP